MAKTVIEGQRKDKLRHVKLSDILIEDRAREDLGNIEELAESVRAKGIIQPITLDSNLKLLAGGRRYAAATACGLETVPAIIRDSDGDLDALEIELFENIHRKDFTWAERAVLTNRINEFYKDKDPNWSGRKTAELLDKSHGGIADQIKMAKALEIMPELAEYKTENDARKVLKKLEEEAIVHELRQRQDARQASTEAPAGALDRGIMAAVKVAGMNYNVGDTFAGMEGLRSGGKIDLIECDPPYGIDLNDQKASKDSVTSNVHTYGEVEREDYPEFLAKLSKELFRIAAPNSWLVFWYGPTWHQLVLTNLREAGWIVDEIPAIWAKKQGQTLQPEKYFARCYEPFFLCRKGNPVMVERGRSNVFDFAGVAGTKKYHPTERPVPLIEEILKTLLVGQAQVFIPFLGSGATLRACYNLGFKGFGFDLNGEYKDKFLLAVEEDSRRLLTQQ